MNFRSLFLDKKILWILFAAILLSNIVSAGIDFVAFREILKKKSAEISSLIGEGDELAIQNSIDELQKNFERQIEVHTFDEGVIKTHVYKTGTCVPNYEDDLFIMGVKVGGLSACIRLQPLLIRGLATRFFFLTFSLIQFFGMLYLVFTKSATEKNLISLIKYLESDQNKRRYLGRKSELFLKIEELIESREIANQNAAESRLSYEKEKVLADLAKQVAHDIRSPLMALKIAMKNESGIDYERRKLLEQACSRINSIAEDLLIRSREYKVINLARPGVQILAIEPIESVFFIGPVVDKIIGEKLATFSNIYFETSGVESSVRVRGVGKDFERMLSNLLQNAIEAVEGTHEPKVQVALRHYSSKLQLMIMDNGKGIPASLISRVGEEGFTYGKSNGNGLGVSYAKKKMKEWQGDLHISSFHGRGTILSLSFQCSSVSASIV